jgi:hypothetical protein
MDAGKNVLTIIHVIIAAIVTPVGLSLARGVASDKPVQSSLVALLAIVLPVFIATRVAWRAGFEAARRSSGSINGSA